MKEALGSLDELRIGNEWFYSKNTYDLKIDGLWVTMRSNTKLSLIEFLDRIGPYLFTGYGEISRHPKHKGYLRYYGNIPMNAVWWLG
ncbi:hypothetical protein [Thermococcus sp.]|uniref:hypothetical protein n=1 Tax=Thermococcus sp. TaxID=35749 RepID=UPI0026031959|nr:hypothetical protein [Thermococcus sp.]